MDNKIDYKELYETLLERQMTINEMLDEYFNLLAYIRGTSETLTKCIENADKMALSDQIKIYTKYADCARTAVELNEIYHFANTEGNE